ncbi:MAG: NAD(P) transhydrogenase subunit alpha [Alphaproteobacteria bacterium]|nr:NAD(P) transhydrogenase subunit alpha [Alphaproteobacteria bacterium]MDD9920236.1 NAD(P) transhydrogenase subunit alpha [Alphaproteobacteria bacterium]
MEITTLTFLVTVLVFAGFIGYFVIWGVTPALHTPLMAVTNAISGIVVIAAMFVAGAEEFSPVVWEMLPDSVDADKLFYARLLGFFGVMLASINIFGGFAITRRMLSMFRKQGRE